MTREEAIKKLKSWAIASKEAQEVLETLIPELCENETPLTPFQICLNNLLRRVYFAEVPEKQVTKFIVDSVKNWTDKLIELAKTHKLIEDSYRKEPEDITTIKMIEFAVLQMKSERQDTKDRCLAWLEKQKKKIQNKTI